MERSLLLIDMCLYRQPESGCDSRELALIQLVILALLCQQLVVVACFDYLSAADDDYLVSVAYRG